MGKVKGSDKDYTPFDLLVMAIESVGNNLLKYVDIKELKDRYNNLSSKDRKELLDTMVQESLAAEGGVVNKLSPRMAKKSANIVKNLMEDETLIKTSQAMGVGTQGVRDVSGKLVTELDSKVAIDPRWRKKLKRVLLSSAPLSPESVYKLEKSGSGSKIYRTMDLADQGMNRFMVNEVRKFHEALGKIKSGSDSSKRVGRALDGKLDVKQLDKEEVRLYDFLKDKFDFLINKYAKSSLGTDARYKKVAGAASRDIPPMVLVKDLSKGLRNEYDKQVVNIIKFMSGKTIVGLDKKERKIYDGMKGELDKIKHRGWLESLDKTEREVYSLMKRKVKNYLPHIFDKDELLKGLELEKSIINTALGKATESKEINKLKKRLVSVDNSIDILKGGGLVTYESLPQNIRFKFFDTRKGTQGYSFDAVKAYESYLRGISRKIYQEPAVKQVGELFKDLSPEYRQYVTKHVKDWLGMGRTGAQELADIITSYQWMSKLGMNPRSALTNFAQRVNTIAKVGEGNAVIGYLKGWTKAGDELFKQTGLAQEVPSVLMEGKVPEGMERFKNALGYLFTKVEIGNRKSAFLAGVEQAKKMGLSEKEAIQHGIDIVHETQFRYGSIGMPAPMRTAAGKVGMQFWSYPIKQMEFLGKLTKNNPMGLLKWVIYAEGARELLEEKAGLDFGNALGFGFNWGEFVEAAKQVPEGDWDNFWKHVRLANSGGGLVPGYSPSISSGLKIVEGASKGKGLETLGKELVPTQAKKISKLYKGIKDVKEVDGKVEIPRYDSKSRLDIMLSPSEAIVETFGPRLEKLSWLDFKKSSEYEMNQLKINLKDELGVAIREGDVDRINELGSKLLDLGDISERIVERQVPWEDRYQNRRDPVQEELLR